MKKKYKRLLGVVAIIAILLVIILIIINLFGNKKEVDNDIIDSIKDYGYTLEESDSKLFKETYEELKEILSKDDIDEEAYAKKITELFVIDLFTIKTKISKYDVGGTEFIHPDYVENYKLNVEDTLYKIVENDVEGNRKQELPMVSQIKSVELEESTFTIGEEEHDAYINTISWFYEDDLGYDEFAVVTLIKIEEKLYIVEYKTEEEE